MLSIVRRIGVIFQQKMTGLMEELKNTSVHEKVNIPSITVFGFPYISWTIEMTKWGR